VNKVIAGLSALALSVGAAVAVAPVAAAAPQSIEASVITGSKVTKKDREYLRSLRFDAPWLESVGNSMLIRTGKQTCRTLRAGATAYDVIDAGLRAGLDDDDIVALVSNAVFYYCPNQAYKFE
jgi:hypothetical protein